MEIYLKFVQTLPSFVSWCVKVAVARGHTQEINRKFNFQCVIIIVYQLNARKITDHISKICIMIYNNVNP